MVLLVYFFNNVELDFIFFSWFHNTKKSPKISNLNVKMFFEFLEFPNAMNIENIEFKLMHLDLSAVGLLDKDLSDSNLDFLETDVDSFPVNILLVYKTSGRWPQDMSWRLPQHDNFLPSRKSWRCLGRQRIATLKTSSRHLQDMSWWRLQDVLEINKSFLGYC